MWQHGALNITEYKDGQPFDQTIFFHNSTYLVSVPPEHADFTDKVVHKHRGRWGAPLTERYAVLSPPPRSPQPRRRGAPVPLTNNLPSPPHLTSERWAICFWLGSLSRPSGD